tara:strand:- start:2431 stop:2595 length:165 start_codon:yes stop_codon:yes gene_type:complete
MSSDTIFGLLILLACFGSGMILGAFFAARGFKRSLVDVLDDPKSPWNNRESADD